MQSGALYNGTYDPSVSCLLGADQNQLFEVGERFFIHEQNSIAPVDDPSAIVTTIWWDWFTVLEEKCVITGGGMSGDNCTSPMVQPMSFSFADTVGSELNNTSGYNNLFGEITVETSGSSQ